MCTSSGAAMSKEFRQHRDMRLPLPTNYHKFSAQFAAVKEAMEFCGEDVQIIFKVYQESPFSAIPFFPSRRSKGTIVGPIAGLLPCPETRY